MTFNDFMFILFNTMDTKGYTKVTRIIVNFIIVH